MSVIVLTALILCTGCTTATVTTDTGAVLSGRVYDENGVPLAGVTLRSGRFRGLSDEFGRFRIDGLPRGSRDFETERNGFESHSFTVTLQSPHQFARVTLWSFNGIMDQAISAVKRGDTAAARSAFERCRAIDPEDRRVHRLASLLEYLQGAHQ
jgi:hypothetical protein